MKVFLAPTSSVNEPGQLWRGNSRRVRTHEKNSGETVRRLGTIIQCIFCAQSGASIRLTVWKWSGESRYSGAFPNVLENFRRAFSPDPTDRPGSPRMLVKLPSSLNQFSELPWVDDITF